MGLLFLIFLMPLSTLAQLVVNTTLPSSENFAVLYDEAINLYLAANYEQTKNYIELALADKRFRDVMLLKCDGLCSLSNTETITTILKKQKCVKNCMNKKFSEVVHPSYYVKSDFESRKTYSFLQYAYFKIGDLKSAYEAVITNLKYNEDDSMMKKNERYYGKRIIKEHVMLREPLTSVDLIRSAISHYSSKNYHAAVDEFKQSLEALLKEIPECKRLCSITYDNDSRNVPSIAESLDFYDQFAKIYGSVAECRYDCMEKYNSKLSGDEDYLPALLNFLQFSAFKAGDVVLAAAAAKTHLAISPGDVTMANNLKYYAAKTAEIDALPGVIDLLSSNSHDTDLLTTIVGKREMKRRLKNKMKVILGDTRSLDDLVLDSDTITWNL